MVQGAGESTSLLVAKTAEVYYTLHRMPLMLDQVRCIIETPVTVTSSIEPSYRLYAVETPRGILYQRFTLDEKGML